jgi:hypothetical protein
MKDLITEARELCDREKVDNPIYFLKRSLTIIPELCDALEKAEERIKLLEGAIDRQNNTIAYLSSTNGQGFNW